MNKKTPDPTLKIDPKAVLENSTEVKCPNPDCDSTLFFPTISTRKVSGLMTGTGKPGAFTVAGPLLCVKCHRELVDADFGYKEEKPKEVNEEAKDSSSG